MTSKANKDTKEKLFNPGEKLTVNRVSEIRDNIVGLLSEEKDLKLDLSDIRECDTAGIQILVALKIYGNQQGRTISIINKTEPVLNEALALGFSSEDLFM
ncbi:MAG: STAS domain-containing protein [Desulfobacteraceae bacterium]|jgi:ABC-type transporter Mla MlaB component